MIQLTTHNTIALADGISETLSAANIPSFHKVNILNVGPGRLWFCSDKNGAIQAVKDNPECEMLPAMVADNGIEFDQSISVIADGSLTIVVRLVV